MDLSICMPSLHRVAVLHSRVLDCYGLYGEGLVVLCSRVQCLGKQSRQCPISRSLRLANGMVIGIPFAIKYLYNWCLAGRDLTWALKRLDYGS